MELKNFIKETLVQITQGVKEAQEETKEMGTHINPSGLIENNQLKFGYNDEFTSVQKIKMSVAIATTEGADVKAGVGLIHVLSLGVSSKVEEKTAIENRIEFEIPICLPVSMVTEKGNRGPFIH